MFTIQTMRSAKLALFIAILIALFALTGCQGLHIPLSQPLFLDLQQHGINFQPSNPFFGTVSGVFPPTLYPLAIVGYERRAEDGVLIDTFLLHLTQSVTETEQIKNEIQAYAAEPFGLGGLDLAGPLRYYQCDKLIFVYQASWQNGIDLVVDEVLTKRCGAAFVRFPLDE